MNSSGRPLFSEDEINELAQIRKSFAGMSYIVGGYDVGHLRQPQPMTARTENVTQGTSLANPTAANDRYHDEQDPAASRAGSGASCNVDHGILRWATTLNSRTGQGYCLPLKEDTGTEVNWIAPELVVGLACEIYESHEASVFHDFGGRNFEVSQCVRLSLKGSLPKTQSLECFVAPAGFPLPCVIIGSKFMSNEGSAQILFLDKPPQDPAFLMIQGEKKEAEQLEIEAMRAERERRANASESQRRSQQSRSATATQAPPPQNPGTTTSSSSSAKGGEQPCAIEAKVIPD